MTMRLVKICNNLRYSSKHHHHHPISSLGYVFNILHNLNSIPSKPTPSNWSNFTPQIAANLWGFDKITSPFRFRLYSTSCIDSSYAKTCRNFAENDASNGDINLIIDIIRGNRSDMESKLNLVGSDISRFMLEILHSLNLLKIPALHFYTWFKNAHPSYSRNSDICSLVVANCGFLDDYDAMLKLLIDFRNHQICLNEKAFRFLPIPSSNLEMSKKSVREVIGLLNHVGGSCRNSGVHSLIELLCSFGSFDLAKYVVEITERKVSYYRILVKHLCMNGQFEEALNLFQEMRRVKCEPDSRMYNYLISSLCKQGSIDEAFAVPQEMLTRGCSPDLLTFEILIYFSCRYGRSDQAIMFYKQMASTGVKPRLSTHYAFIRGYFSSQQFDEAYNYVISSAAMDRCAAQDIYNVLASLHIREGDVLVVNNILVEMLEKGLKPKHSVFRRAVRCLCKNGKEHFAENLKARYCSQDVR